MTLYVTLWHAVISNHLRAYFWRISRFCFNWPPTSNMIPSFPYFQSVLSHSIWPRGHGVILVERHHVSISITTLFWLKLCMMLHSLAASFVPHDQHIFPFLWIDQQNMICVITYHIQTLPNWEMFVIVFFSLHWVTILSPLIPYHASKNDTTYIFHTIKAQPYMPNFIFA